MRHKDELILSRPRREPISAFTAAMISAGITAGTSLAGTTVHALMASGYNVAVSGSVENYSQWPMILRHCDHEAGQTTIPMIDINTGKKEGFASHKTGHTATGVWVYCLYAVNNKHVHIMYSAPYSFDFHSNWLALAITSSATTLDADKMYYKSYSHMARQEYDDRVVPTEICRQGLCIKGSMGTSHKPTVTIQLYPQSFKNVSPSVSKNLDSKNAESKYEKFIDSLFIEAYDHVR